MTTSLSSPAVPGPLRTSRLRSWRTAVSVTAAAGGITMIVGAFLPWVEAFGGLMQFPGVRGGNGRILAGVGILIVVASLWHALHGANLARWLIGVAGFGSMAFSGYLLIRLAESIRSLGGDSMVIARGGPGLWATAAGSLLAFATMFLPPSSQTTLRSKDARGLLAWASAGQSTGARRGLQIALGLLWLLDAALQYQPPMFGTAFVSRVLGPSAMGNPPLVADPVMSAGQLIAHNVAAWNAAFATIQLALAAGLLWRPAAKAALAGTIAWSLAVWWLGEGLGGILTGTASPVTGAPGAAFLYALIAILIWPASSGNGEHACVAAASPLGGRWARLLWPALWGSLGYLMLQPPTRAPLGLRDAIAGQAAGEPAWIASADHTLAAAIGSHGTVISVVLAILFAGVAAGVCLPAATKPALAAGAITAIVIWAAGENLGGIFTGSATDPNTGPLLILLAAAYWPRTVTHHAEAAASRTSGSTR